MKTITSLLLYIILLSCASQRTDESSIDSTANTTDTALVTETAAEESVQPISVPKPPSNFPEYSDQRFTDFAEEQSTGTALFALMDKYNAAKFILIKSDYVAKFPGEATNDFEETFEVTQTQNRTWYYDSAIQLRAYSETFKFGEESRTTIYLFADEELIAIYEDEVQKAQNYETIKRRAVHSLYPSVGVEIQNPDPNPIENQIIVLDGPYWDSIATVFSYDYSDLMKLLNSGLGKKNSDGSYSFQEKKKVDNDISYDINYIVDSRLVKDFVKEETQ